MQILVSLFKWEAPVTCIVLLSFLSYGPRGALDDVACTCTRRFGLISPSWSLLIHNLQRNVYFCKKIDQAIIWAPYYDRNTKAKITRMSISILHDCITSFILGNERPSTGSLDGLLTWVDEPWGPCRGSCWRASGSAAAPASLTTRSDSTPLIPWTLPSDPLSYPCVHSNLQEWSWE